MVAFVNERLSFDVNSIQTCEFLLRFYTLDFKANQHSVSFSLSFIHTSYKYKKVKLGLSSIWEKSKQYNSGLIRDQIINPVKKKFRYLKMNFFILK